MTEVDWYVGLDKVSFADFITDAAWSVRARAKWFAPFPWGPYYISDEWEALFSLEWELA